MTTVISESSADTETRWASFDKSTRLESRRRNGVCDRGNGFCVPSTRSRTTTVCPSATTSIGLGGLYSKRTLPGFWTKNCPSERRPSGPICTKSPTSVWMLESVALTRSRGERCVSALVARGGAGGARSGAGAPARNGDGRGNGTVFAAAAKAPAIVPTIDTIATAASFTVPILSPIPLAILLQRTLVGDLEHLGVGLFAAVEIVDHDRGVVALRVGHGPLPQLEILGSEHQHQPIGADQCVLLLDDDGDEDIVRGYRDEVGVLEQINAVSKEKA